MLIQKITPVKDYDKTLKLRRLWAIAMLTISLVGFVCYGLLVPSSDLSSHAKGFYLGAATGLFSGALVLLWRTRRVMDSPEAKRKARIEEMDERRTHIINKAYVYAGLFTFFMAALGVFIVVPLSMDAYYALLSVMAVYVLAFVIASFWLARRV